MSHEHSVYDLEQLAQVSGLSALAANNCRKHRAWCGYEAYRKRRPT